MSTGPIREIRAISSKYLLFAAVCLFFAIATAAHADTVNNITADPATPVVDENVDFTDTGGIECPSGGPAPTYTFSYHSADGTTADTTTAPSSGRTDSRSFGRAGDYTITVKRYCGTSQIGSSSRDLTVHDQLGGSISLTPDPPVRSQTTTLEAAATNGNPGYTFSWDLNNDGTFGDSTSRTVDQTYATTGPRTVAVKITDNREGNFTNTHTATITRTFNVADPPPPPAAGEPAPPPPPPCVKRLSFELSEFTTTGCFKQTGTSPERWDTTASVKLNGIVFPDFGQHFVVTYPTDGELGGHFSAPNSTMELGSFTPYSGDIDWSLPARGKVNDTGGYEEQFKRFSATLGTKILGLNVLGSIALRLGVEADGKYYATFPLNVELPGGFRAGPGTDYGRVTGSAALRVDVDGVHYAGLKLEAKNVWIGKLKVESTCFSYVPAGTQDGTITQCAQPSFDGTATPYIKCATDASADRWDGNAVVLLPSGKAGRVGAFGGVVGNQLGNLGATLSLKKGIPIAPNTTLNSASFGICLKPPPLKIKGTIGIGILPLATGSVVGIDGSIEYTDGDSFHGWRLQVGGSVTVFDKNLGEGSVTIRAYDGFDFNINSKVDVYGIVSLAGSIDGWVDVSRSLFNISGSVYACVGGAVCGEGSGVVSSTGIAGCVTLTSTAPSPDLIVTFDPLRVRFADSVTRLTAGFGYVWNASAPDLFAGSCDFAPYTTQRTFTRAAGAGISEHVARGTSALTLAIHGSHGPPKVVLRGPRGATITSPAKGTGKQSKGRYLLAENPRNSTTNIMLIRPAAGTWTISTVPGTKSQPTVVNRAKYQMPPTFGATVRAHGASRSLSMVYAVPKGASVRLVERAKGIARTVSGRVVGRRCAAGPQLRPGSDQPILCARVRFHPSRGPGGRRTVQAVVSRGGVPLLQKDIASFTAPRETLPSRPGALRARRANGFLVVAFPRSRGASRYVVSATLSDGRELAFDLAKKCQAVRIANVPTGVSATVKVAGVRYDLQSGAKRSISVASDALTAGPRGKLPKRLWRARRTCS